MSYKFTVALLLAVLLVNIYLAANPSTGLIYRFSTKAQPYPQLFSYIDDDYPDILQIPHPGLPFVTLRVEDSEHYLITASENTSTPEDKLFVNAEWESLFPRGDGFIRPAAHGRQFTVSMFHQLHCINNIRLALARQPVRLYHVHHCMNYLRQMILCASNMRLEPLSRRLKEKSNLTAVDGLGLTHVCRDWSTVYRIFEDQYTKFEENNTLT